MSADKKKHDFHLVDPSPWPIYVSFATLVLAAKPVKECRDGIDNDGDGLFDWPNDPGCHNKNDNDDLLCNHEQLEFYSDSLYYTKAALEERKKEESIHFPFNCVVCGKAFYSKG